MQFRSLHIIAGVLIASAVILVAFEIVRGDFVRVLIPVAVVMFYGAQLLFRWLGLRSKIWQGGVIYALTTGVPAALIVLGLHGALVWAIAVG